MGLLAFSVCALIMGWKYFGGDLTPSEREERLAREQEQKSLPKPIHPLDRKDEA